MIHTPVRVHAAGFVLHRESCNDCEMWLIAASLTWLQHQTVSIQQTLLAAAYVYH